MGCPCSRCLARRTLRGTPAEGSDEVIGHVALALEGVRRDVLTQVRECAIDVEREAIGDEACEIASAVTRIVDEMAANPPAHVEQPPPEEDITW